MQQRVKEMPEAVHEKNIVNLPGISLGMILQIQIEGFAMAHSRLVGLSPGEFLIVKTPPMVGKDASLFENRVSDKTKSPVRPYEKNHVIIRYFSSGWVYGFRCTLLSLINFPSRLAIVSYPESIEKINLRKYERVPCNVDAEIIIAEKPYAGVVKNISFGGASFEHKNQKDDSFPPLRLQDIIQLAIHNEHSEAATFSSVVRNIKLDNETMTLGLEFCYSDGENGEAEQAKSFIESLFSES
jgi:hypothetical protein